MEEKFTFLKEEWFMWLMLVIFAPVGIFLMWKYNQKFKDEKKFIIAGIFLVIFVLIWFPLLGNSQSKANEPTAEQIAADNLQVVQSVEKKINAFREPGTVTVESLEKFKIAKNAYNGLSSEQKGMLSFETLKILVYADDNATILENKAKEEKAAADKVTADKAATDKAAADQAAAEKAAADKAAADQAAAEKAAAEAAKPKQILGSSQEQVKELLKAYKINTAYQNNVDPNAIKFEGKDLIIVIEFDSNGLAEGVIYISGDGAYSGKGSYVDLNYDKIISFATGGGNYPIANNVNPDVGFEYPTEIYIGTMHR
ncbi:hypothetical protein FXB42_06715 [Acetobacterium wieringae]|uniref:Uncharacterized protein n=1 Tax=Acetobacterium wieringae TaxID=52694 RepID=A0A5D0WQP5_9FIRM|nr:hypothetical protein [Acetobacterium wieringae]TYC86373.1 hypothetical protein FXB42_06715 [Acetobacterium wieringae]